MFAIEHKVAQTAKRAGFLSGGLLLCAVGCGFLTVAAWVALIPTLGIDGTALVIAGAYIGVGLICFGLGRGTDTKPAKPEPHIQQNASTSDKPPIVQAFMYGLQAGAQADQRRHS